MFDCDCLCQREHKILFPGNPKLRDSCACCQRHLASIFGQYFPGIGYLSGNVRYPGNSNPIDRLRKLEVFRNLIGVLIAI